jgi:preprotein translocase subunit SecA
MTQNLVEMHKNGGTFESFRQESVAVVGIDPKMEEIDFIEGRTEEVIEKYQEQVFEFYDKKGQQIGDFLLPMIKNVLENEGHRYRRISVPFTDGRSKMLPVSADLRDAVESNGKTVMRDIEKAVTLAMIDDKWKEHLRSMDELKDSSQAASFEQKDPLVVYKMEAFNLFEDLIFGVNEDVTSYLSKGTLVFRDGRSLEEAKEQKTNLKGTSTNRTGENPNAVRQRQAAEGVSRQKVETFKRTQKKVGRNEPCPCGSGKKYKQCHGKK